MIVTAEQEVEALSLLLEVDAGYGSLARTIDQEQGGCLPPALTLAKGTASPWLSFLRGESRALP
jgi:hypothetical protein